MPREPDRRPVPVRVARHGRAVVAQLWQRAVAVRRTRPDGAPRGEHQRPADRGNGPPDLRPAPGGRTRRRDPAPGGRSGAMEIPTPATREVARGNEVRWARVYQ